MTEHDHARDHERLSEAAARQLLTRASELEAARVADMSVAELREAAREAGIASGAFEQALAELRAGGVAAAAMPAPSRLKPLARIWPAALIVAVLLHVVVIPLLFPAV